MSLEIQRIYWKKDLLMSFSAKVAIDLLAGPVAADDADFADNAKQLTSRMRFRSDGCRRRGLDGESGRFIREEGTRDIYGGCR
jgi:hypothetical protein